MSDIENLFAKELRTNNITFIRVENTDNQICMYCGKEKPDFRIDEKVFHIDCLFNFNTAIYLESECAMYNNHNIGVDVAGMIASLQPGVKRAILRVLSYHQGRGNAIARRDLLVEVTRLVPVNDRQLRLVINDLRKDGALICSTGGIDGGYWLAADDDEMGAYLESEIWARVRDLTEQGRALQQARERRFGKREGTQLGMGL